MLGLGPKGCMEIAFRSTAGQRPDPRVCATDHVRSPTTMLER